MGTITIIIHLHFVSSELSGVTFSCHSPEGYETKSCGNQCQQKIHSDEEGPVDGCVVGIPAHPIA
jgi:hypothetical protein